MDVEIKSRFEACFRILKVFGVWIDGKETRRYRIYGITMIFFCPFLFFVMLTSGIYHRVKSHGFLEQAEPITFILATFVLNGRILDFVNKINDIKSLYDKADDIIKRFMFNDIHIKRRMKTYSRIFNFSLISAILSVIAGYFVSFQSHKLPYPVATPFSVDDETGFWIVYIYLFIAVGYVGPLYPALGLLPIFFMNFAIGWMEDFNDRLESFGRACQNFKDEKEQEILIEELQNLVDVYQEIQNFLKKITEIFKLTFFIKGIVGSIIICTSVFVTPLVSSKIYKIF
jgi:hypothetical protein